MITNLFLIHLFLALLAGFYYLVLKNKGLPRVNRAYLLLAPIVALLFPFLGIQGISQTIYEIRLPSFSVTGAIAKTEQGTIGWFWWTWTLIGIYGAGFIFKLTRLIAAFIRVHQLKNQGMEEFHQGKRLIRVPQQGVAFSFAGKIFIGEDVEVNRVMLDHESAHIEQGHTWDLLYYELFHVLLWYDPFMPWLKKVLKTEHELEADRSVISVGYEPGEYSRFLLEHLTAYRFNGPVHSFNQTSQIKTRIHMMYERPKRFTTVIRLAMVVPVLLSMIFIASCQDKNAESSSSSEEKNEVVEEPDEQPTFGDSQQALFQYLGEKLEYPESAKEEKTEGVVRVSFVVGKGGNVRDLEVLNEADPRLEKEALRVIEKMPPWNPGKKDGKAVPVKMVLPVKFKL